MTQELISELITGLATIYLLVVPFICNTLWQETKLTFIKWYFTKSESVNWLGFLVFLILCSGSFYWYALVLLAELMFYVIVLPVCWLFEFLFLNKDCTNIICEELDDSDKLKEKD